MSLIENALARLRQNGHSETASSAKGVSPVPPLRDAGTLQASSPQREKRIVVDDAVLRAAGYLPEQGLERRFADHYRQIKRPLIERALAGPTEMRVLLITSALPGDGKTFTSINLALSMARERDISVLLVDADGPRARISEVFKLRGDPGLLDALADEAIDPESLIVGTDVRGLEILPAGRLIENSTELFASARMNQIATQIALHNPRRLVLMDSAPLLASSEARALMRIPAQIVLVVRADVTPQRAVAEAVALLDKKRLQGLVVNQARFVPSDGYYGYGSYGDESGHGRKPS